MARRSKKERFEFMPSSPPFLLGWSYIGYHLHPTTGTAFDVRVVALRILTVIPVVGLFLLRIAIHRGLLPDHGRR
jgi:hypothetical protein